MCRTVFLRGFVMSLVDPVELFPGPEVGRPLPDYLSSSHY